MRIADIADSSKALLPLLFITEAESISPVGTRLICISAEIQINLVPTGEILSASVIKSSGNKAFDESAMSAILKVKSFEGLTMQMQLFDQHFRKFTLVFTPE